MERENFNPAVFSGLSSANPDPEPVVEEEVQEEEVVEEETSEVEEPEVVEYEEPELGDREKALLQHFQAEVPAEPVEQVLPTITHEAITEAVVGEDLVTRILEGDANALSQAFQIVLNKAVEIASTRSVEGTLKSLPDITARHFRQQQAAQELVNDFYERNKDLKPVKQVVASVANRIAADHADYSMSKLFDEAAKETRKLLGIRAKVVEKQQPEKKATPAFVGTKGGNNRVTKPPTEKTLQQEVAALFNLGG